MVKMSYEFKVKCEISVSTKNVIKLLAFLFCLIV